MIEELKIKVKEIWEKNYHCVICAVAGFILGAIIL
jgi:hypothetical protein|tara:strand:- start:4430 stop:4534 length:105 start_codon:yes stop_codon:yes gene_type:complete